MSAPTVLPLLPWAVGVRCGRLRHAELWPPAQTSLKLAPPTPPTRQVVCIAAGYDTRAYRFARQGVQVGDWEQGRGVQSGGKRACSLGHANGASVQGQGDGEVSEVIGHEVAESGVSGSTGGMVV